MCRLFTRSVFMLCYWLKHKFSLNPAFCNSTYSMYGYALHTLTRCLYVSFVWVCNFPTVWGKNNISSRSIQTALRHCYPAVALLFDHLTSNLDHRQLEEQKTLQCWVMDHHASGQQSHHSHAAHFQWLSFAYQSLTEIPYETILTQTDSLQVLDLSYNMLEEYPFAACRPFAKLCLLINN